jgi:hypothetical protein
VPRKWHSLRRKHRVVTSPGTCRLTFTTKGCLRLAHQSLEIGRSTTALRKTAWQDWCVKSISQDEFRDKSFGAYLRLTAGYRRGGRYRIVSAACFSAALIVKDGLFGIEIVAGTLIGGVALAYPLWRRWGRDG